MNENINLCEILKDCPKGTKFWSPIFGDCEFAHINQYDNGFKSITVLVPKPYIYLRSNGYKDKADFNCKGAICDGMNKCLLFPSKDQRDWSKWKCPKPKFDPKTLKAFDRVLARIGGGDAYCWFADFVSVPALEGDTTVCVIGDRDVSMIIPYNDDTKHLVGTTDEAPEFYRYWED